MSDDDDYYLDDEEAEDKKEALRVLAKIKAQQEKTRNPYAHAIGPHIFHQPGRYNHLIVQMCEEEGWLREVPPSFDGVIMYELTSEGLKFLQENADPSRET